MSIQTDSTLVDALGLTPAPAECSLFKGSCDLSKVNVIQYNHADLFDTCQYLIDELSKKNITVSTQSLLTEPHKTETLAQSETTVSLVLELEVDAPEHLDYSLSIKPESIRISAREISGVFYAIQTFLQLVSSKQTLVSTLEIKDKARCEYRGLHLDVSRHFRPAEDIRHILDLMAMHKMNFFHWHLVDDQGWRIEINKYPLLTSIGSKRQSTVAGHTLDKDALTDSEPHSGFYTQQEIKEIVAYAQQRHITIIPEIDLPGHSSALLAAYPEYSCRHKYDAANVKNHFGIFRHVLCNRESSFSFLRNLLSEVAELFPYEYIHIGGDEVKKTHWEECPDCQAVLQQESLKDTDELHGYFIDQVVDILGSLGKKAICWDDVLESKNLNPNVAIMSWLGEDKAADALSRGHDLIMTQTNLYFDFYQSLSIDEPFAIHGHAPLSNVYNYDPLQSNSKIIGAQANIWTEYIKTLSQLEYMILPRMTALAEILWTPLAQQNWQSFKQRLKVQYERFDELGLKASRAVFVPEFDISQNTNGSFDVTILSEFPEMDIRYTLDGARPDCHSPSYQSTLTINDRTIINACCVDTNSGQQYGVNKIAIFPHKALNCHVEYTCSNASDPIVSNVELLSNGQLQQGQRFQHSNWALFDGASEFELSLDLGKPTEISAISLGFDGALGRELYFPASVSISSSLDNKEWSIQKKLNHDHALGRSGTTFAPELTRYIRIKIYNSDKIYSHEDEKMVITPLYIDEIVVT